MKAENKRFRRPYLISGEESWVRRSLQTLIPHAFTADACWLSDNAPKRVSCTPHKNYAELIGRDVSLLVYDTFQGFNADCFGLISGAVPGHGLFIMLTPPLLEWPLYQESTPYSSHESLGSSAGNSSVFLSYFSRALINSRTFTKFEQGGNESSMLQIEHDDHVTPGVPTPESFEASDDQSQAISSIIRVANGHRKRPLVLTADRGRGKTSALGIAAARLIMDRPRRIIFTAPRWSAVALAFNYAENILSAQVGKLIKKKHSLQFNQAEIIYIPPDVIISDFSDADLLLIDEAAGLPTPILTQLLQRYSRVVFSTTVHGYEGTGRGFEVRFKSVINRLTPQWQSFHMHEPVRWSAGDALEQFVFEVLLLNAEPCSSAIARSVEVDKLLFSEMDIQRLLKNQKQLVELFGLMVLAHYQTSPNDLRMMLDTPGVRLFTLTENGHIIAATWLVEEGELSEEKTLKIIQGKRRFKGHLVAQSIANHLGLMQSAMLRSARFVRVTVHPDTQGRGIGTHLVDYVVKRIAAEYDYLSSSFGATTDLVNFWLKNGFKPLRLGFKREASSGEHALMVGAGVSAAGLSLIDTANKRFNNDFPLQLNELFPDLDVNLLSALLQNNHEIQEPAGYQQDIETLTRFVAAYQSYDSSSVAIWRCLTAYPRFLDQLDEGERQVVVKKALLKMSWADVVKSGGLSGKKEALNIMRAGLSKISSSI